MNLMKKHTKIVATLSDLKCDVEFIQELYDAGMNVVRINTAHQSPEGSMKLINNVRKVSDKIAFLVDTKGPEVRTTEADKGIIVKRGESISLSWRETAGYADGSPQLAGDLRASLFHRSRGAGV